MLRRLYFAATDDVTPLFFCLLFDRVFDAVNRWILNF